MHDFCTTHVKLLDFFIIMYRQYFFWKFISMWRTLRSVTRFLTLITVHCKTCDTYGGKEKCIQLGQPKIKRQRWRPRRKWKNNNKMPLKEIGWEWVDWIDVAQVREKWWAPWNTVMNLTVPLNAENFLTSRRTLSFLRRTLLHGII